MLFDKLSSNPEWTEQKLALMRQHHAEWQFCFDLEDESWHSLQRRHYRQCSELEAHSLDVLKRVQLIKQQIQDIQDWHKMIDSYRQTLRAHQAGETLNLDEAKRALSTHFLP
ncbi:hypothetical protein [Spirosoma utsteinense]|uniref:Glycogen synthase n=1 Tax=Spirosoma utsteinense TaxID=2585773 RepID=A0ABR6WFD7_9BACT|nr:hypothetical protein [Spirosoma utsteinense]MBC3789350.1 glycogen synthase [Spirosoma utsteinense]MBC3795246.1 glycogen synthase [Spirosoma utsteinense]